MIILLACTNVNETQYSVVTEPDSEQEVEDAEPIYALER